MEPLNKLQLDVITYIEQIHTKSGKFPTYRKLMNLFEDEPGFDINAYLKHPTFRLALVNRGISAPYSLNTGTPEEGQYEPPKNFSREQMAAITTVINFEDKRPRTVKLKELGISPAQWQGWMRDEHFKTYLQEVSTSTLQDNLYVANEGLMKAVDRGDINAIKLYLEITGRHSDDVPAMRNLKVMLSRLIESVQRHVDPATMRLIAQDFDMIQAGGIPVVQAQAIEQTI